MVQSSFQIADLSLPIETPVKDDRDPLGQEGVCPLLRHAVSIEIKSQGPTVQSTSTIS
jgi:hypothetical protein